MSSVDASMKFRIVPKSKIAPITALNPEKTASRAMKIASPLFHQMEFESFNEIDPWLFKLFHLIVLAVSSTNLNQKYTIVECHPVRVLTLQVSPNPCPKHTQGA